MYFKKFKKAKGHLEQNDKDLEEFFEIFKDKYSKKYSTEEE